MSPEREQLVEENRQCLHLMQALIGAVSPNMRRVTLEVLGPAHYALRFLLAEDDDEDRDEIEDVAFGFEALQSGPVEIETHVEVSRASITEIHLPGRVVYGRRGG